MPSKPVKFKMSDVTRAIRGAAAAGQKVSSVEIDSKGTMRLSLADGPMPSPGDDIIAKLK